MPIHHLLQSCKNPFPNIKPKSLAPREVAKIIKSLKIKNSHGYDEISTKLLKISSTSINSHMCNKLSSEIFPDHLKYLEI